jgi:ABC-type Zn uptake system ZnuABC Zn-binding protein ZnuA
MKKVIILILFTVILLSACNPRNASSATGTPTGGTIKVLAVESFLADITQNLAGNRLKIESLIPLNVDPHSFEPTPADVVKIANSRVIIANGAGFESWLDKTLVNAGGKYILIQAAKDLKSRQPLPGEIGNTDSASQGIDPHFWLDPQMVVHYVETIRDGLIEADLAGKEAYTQNAQDYIQQLNALDQWITQQVSQIPPEQRLLVTNHESFGYFADRYGFKIVGTIIPSFSTGASPSAQQLTSLVDHIKATKVKAIFLETGTNPNLAQQIAQETGIKVVTELYSHSLTSANGPAPNYITMMKTNTSAIVNGLK